MLGKLLKHELRATSKYLVPLYLILMLLSVLNRLALTGDLFHGSLKLIPGFMVMAYVLSIIAVIVVTFVIMVIRFYKNLMSDEGYLMFTLPVKPIQLINSKLIIAIGWNILSVLAVIASLLIVLGTPERMRDFWQIVDTGMAQLRAAFGNQAPIIIFEFVLMILVSVLQNIILIYVSIAVGHLFSGHKLLGSFASYIAINTVMQIFISILLVLGGLMFKTTFDQLESIPQIVFPFSIIIATVFNVLFYFGTDYIFRRKLNLE